MMFSGLGRALAVCFGVPLLVLFFMAGFNFLGSEVSTAVGGFELPVSKTEFSEATNRITDFRVSDVDNFLNGIG